MKWMFAVLGVPEDDAVAIGVTREEPLQPAQVAARTIDGIHDVLQERRRPEGGRRRRSRRGLWEAPGGGASDRSSERTAGASKGWRARTEAPRSPPQRPPLRRSLILHEEGRLTAHAQTRRASGACASECLADTQRGRIEQFEERRRRSRQRAGRARVAASRSGKERETSSRRGDAPARCDTSPRRRTRGSPRHR